MNDNNFERLKKALIYIKSNLIDSDNDIFLTVDSLINISNRIILLWKKLMLKHFDVIKSISIYLIEDKLYQLIDPFSEIKINHTDLVCITWKNTSILW